MSYQVLARKWRPRRFEQVVGQDHVVRTLTNALAQGRLHHAYLFSGTRGVGKTTLARILAKCLNCETGVDSRPCDECGACRELDAGRFIDLIEVDAASRTKVEDTRELLENVQYAPSRGRYKVYLIDEVHMLSGHSFNALLKTLEEPPPHVKFLLATTDPQKLPVTVLSRCLQFNLRRLSQASIAAHLLEVLLSEHITAEPQAVNELARAADGSVRDALSLLDQAIAFGNQTVSMDDVQAMLGSLGSGHMYELMCALADSDGETLMQAVDRLAAEAADFSAVSSEVISLLYQAAFTQALPQAQDVLERDQDTVEYLATRLSPEDIQLYYQIALLGRRDLELAPTTRMALEMVLLRMLSFRPVSPANTAGPADSAAAQPAEHAAATPPAKRGGELDQGADSREVSGDQEDWSAIVARLDLQGIGQQLANNCGLQRVTEDEVVLVLAQKHAQLRVHRAEARLESALKAYLGREIKLRIERAESVCETPADRAQRTASDRQSAAESAIESDAIVRELKDTLGARVVPGSIKPTDSADPS